MKNVKLSKRVKAIVKNFAKSYPQFKGCVESFEDWEKLQRFIDDGKRKEYLLRKKHLLTIEETFKQTVKISEQEKIWNYFYNKAKVEEYERQMIDAEIDKWFCSLAEELGITKLEGMEK
ncbi:MAG: hypothetical protein SPI74_00510 [Eubacterium sp.]|nr:hypothetical protein [Eubacterium sp.]